eukprot:gene7188-14654_t
MLIRTATELDVDHLLDLEKSAWEIHLQANKHQIINRIRTYPLGQYVLEVEGILCGVLYTQRIDDYKLLLTSTSANHHLLHSSNGQILQLIAIAATSSPKGGNIGAALRNHALSVGAMDPSIACVVAMTRCNKFVTSVHDDNQFKSYREYVMSGKDPTIFFHISGGAQVLEIVQGYRNEDVGNLGHGVLIKYDFSKLISTNISTNNEYDPHMKDFINLSSEISSEISRMVKEVRSEEILDTPFMTIIDSLQLMTLHSWLESRVNQTLNPTFLFQYSSPNAVQDYFTGQLIINKSSTYAQETKASAPPHANYSEHKDIAIVGVSCLLPGGIDSMDGLWDTLCNKRDMTGEASLSRWDTDALIVDKNDSITLDRIRYGGFLSDE